ncbi:MAG TPA: hypothetical protein VKU38_06120 [Ktedonobacteraceae bacterium]|nr:hypothetical protein [Ktedonobacteraceae bacterium]
MQGQWSYAVNDTAPYYTVNKVKHSELNAMSSGNITHVARIPTAMTPMAICSPPSPVPARWATTMT